MPELLPLTAADCASSTSETTSENQRKSKIPHPATGGQTAPIPGITRFSITVHKRYHRVRRGNHFAGFGSGILKLSIPDADS
jgi:hypothetical protein